MMSLKSHSKKLAHEIYQRAVMIGKPDTVSLEINNVNVLANQPTLSRKNEIEMLSKEGKFIKECIDDLRSNDVFWDVGAHHGLVSILVAKSTSDVTVVAFEPVDANRQIILEHMSVNNVDDPIVLIDEVLADSVQDMQFNLDMESTAGRHRLVKEYDVQNTVTTTSGDRLICEDGLPSPDVVKIDVEGAELLVLKGMENSLSDCHGVYVELHPDQYQSFDYDSTDIKNYLQNQGFPTSKFKTDRSDLFLQATK